MDIWTIIPRPSDMGKRLLPPVIKKFPFLKYLPIWRQYAPGGKYAPVEEPTAESPDSAT